MTKEEIEKLQLLASNNEELVYTVATKISDEYSAIGHDMHVLILRSARVVRAQVLCRYCGKVVLVEAFRSLRIEFDTKEKCMLYSY